MGMGEACIWRYSYHTNTLVPLHKTPRSRTCMEASWRDIIRPTWFCYLFYSSWNYIISSIINFLYPLNRQAVLTSLPYNYMPLHFNQWIIGPWTSPTSHSSLHPFFSFQNIILLMSILRVMDNEINLELQQYFANTSSTSLEGVYFYHKNQR